MIRSTLATIAAAAFLISAGPAHAILLNGNYTVTANSNSATGLAVQTLNDLGSPVNATTNSFTALNVPAPGTRLVDLFQIFALDPSPFSGNDFVAQVITVLFNITGPFSGTATITGNTRATDPDTALLHWNGPATIFFPDNTPLKITLLDAEFSDAFNGTVLAQLAIPEPGTLALLGLGLLGAGIRRKRVAA